VRNNGSGHLTNKLRELMIYSHEGEGRM